MNNDMEQTTQTTNEVSENVSETFVAQDSQNLQNLQNTQTPTSKPPKKKKKIGGWIALGIVAVAAVIVGLNFKSIEASVRKLVMSPEKYYRYVEEQAMENSSEHILKFYDRLLEGLDTTKDRATQNTLQVTLGEQLKYLMETIDEEVFDNIESIGLDIYSSQYDNALKQTVTGDFLLNENSMVNAEILFDYQNEEMFVGMPNISEQYLSMDVSELLGINAEDMKTLMELLSNISKQLPDRKDAFKLLERYVTLILENVENVEEEKSTLDVEGISQTCTEFSFDLDVTQLRKLAVKVLEEVLEDKELEGYITGVISELEKIENIDVDAEKAYDSFVNKLEDTIDDLKDLIEEDEDEDSDELEVTVWVDKKGKVIGRKYEVEDSFLFFYAMTTKGDKYGFESELSYDDEIFVIKGEGNIEKENITGTFDLDLINKRIVTVELKKLSPKKLEEGLFEGTIILTPDGATEDLIEIWNEDEEFEIKDPEIIISMNQKEKESEFVISAQNDGELFAELSYVYKEEEAKKSDFPKKEDTLDAQNEEELVNWVSGLDAEALENKMKEQNIPDVAAEGVSDYVRMIKYDVAWTLFRNENYKEAGKLFETIKDYDDAGDMKLCCDATLLYEEGKYDEALELLESVEEYNVYAEYQKEECLYKKAGLLIEEERYKEAIDIYEELRYSFDSADMLEYAWGKYYLEGGDFAEAEYHFGLVDESVIDVSEDIKECTYQRGLSALENGNYSEAYGYFMLIQGYKDADALAAQADAEVAILQAPVGTVFAPNYEDYIEGVILPDKYLGIEMEKLTDREFREYLTAFVTEKMMYAMGTGEDVVYEPEVSFSDAAAEFMSNGKYSTEESYKAYLFEQCEDEKYAPQLRDYLAAYAFVSSHDEEYIRKQLSRVMFAAVMEAAQYGLGTETYVSLIGYESLDEFKAEREQMIRDNDTAFIASYAIAKKEGIVITDEVFMTMADEFAYEYGITTDHFLELNDRELLEQVFMIELAMEYMIDNANKIEQ